MCRGLAVGYDTQENKMICKGLSSHTETFGEREDYCIRLEAVVDTSLDDGFKIELDDDNRQLKKWSGGKYVTSAYCMTKHLTEIVDRWGSRNKSKILKHIISLQSYAEIGEQYQNSAKIGEQNQSCAKIGEQYQRYAEIEKQNQRYAEIEEQDQYCAKIGEQYQRSAKIGEQDISFLTLTKDAELTELIQQQSEGEKPLSWSELVRWAVSNHEEAKRILGK